MAPQATATRSRTPLDRQRVLAAAQALVDAEGLDAPSMRRLGAVLGVEAMSLSKHVVERTVCWSGPRQVATLVGVPTPGEGS